MATKKISINSKPINGKNISTSATQYEETVVSGGVVYAKSAITNEGITSYDGHVKA